MLQPADMGDAAVLADALKRLWPVFVEPKVRDWFNEHLQSGSIERVTIAVNAPAAIPASKATGSGKFAAITVKPMKPR